MTRRVASDCPVPKGILVIIGGKENKGEDPQKEVQKKDFLPEEVLKCFRELVRRKAPVLEVITTASGAAAEQFREYRELFKQLGFTEIRQLHHEDRKAALEDDLAERVKTADAFFLSGGDQLKLTSIYGGTQFLTDLKERYIRDQVVIAGTSAGAMALSTPMIYAGNKDVEEMSGAIKITTGLEFLKDVCIDTHFVQRGRFVRLAQVVASNPSCIGMGVEEDTALVVRNGFEGEVIGTGTIIIIEGFQLTHSNILEFTEEKPISIRDMRVHLISRGDTYEIPQANPPHR